jgi:hypothetical protein
VFPLTGTPLVLISRPEAGKDIVIGVADCGSKPELLAIDTKSFVPSQSIQPSNNAEYVAPFVSVPLLPVPVKSVQVVPEPGYDAGLLASKCAISPDVIKPEDTTGFIILP